MHTLPYTLLSLSRSQDTNLDADDSMQRKLHQRAVDMLTGPLASREVAAANMASLGMQRTPYDQEFDNLWQDLVATAISVIKSNGSVSRQHLIETILLFVRVDFIFRTRIILAILKANMNISHSNSNGNTLLLPRFGQRGRRPS